MNVKHFFTIRISFLLTAILTLQHCQIKKDDSPWIAIPPAYDQYLKIDTNGKTILPNG